VKYLNFYNIQEPLLQYRIHGDNLSLTSKDFSNHVKQVKKNMISSLTSNDKVKNALMKKYVEKKNYWRNIFSISNGVNAKIVTILGLRINL
jgi:hypothetical protein